MRLRLALLAVAAGAGALALPAHASVPAVDCHGTVFTDAAGDQWLGTSANFAVRPTKAVDITRVYLTGSGSTEHVNIEVAQLSAWNNTEYSFTWLDNVSFPYSWELNGRFLGTNTGDASTQASLFHKDINGSTVAQSGHATVAAFHGDVVNGVEGPGVIQLTLPQDWGPLGFPATITGMKAAARQYESNVLTSVALRQDSAAYDNPSNGNNWTQPC